MLKYIREIYKARNRKRIEQREANLPTKEIKV